MKTKIIPFDLETALDIQKGNIEGKIVRNGREVIILDYVSMKYPGFPLRIVYRDKDEVDYVNCEGLHIKVFCNGPQFKPFDRVLVRENDASLWRTGFYSHELDGYHCVCGNYYRQCISYDGNQELLGTTKKPKEE